jgi:hypothetical protein
MTRYISIKINADNDDQAILEIRDAISRLRNMQAELTQSRSKVTGVCWDKCNQKWKARKGCDGRMVTLGYFGTYEEAVSAVKGFIDMGPDSVR